MSICKYYEISFLLLMLYPKNHFLFPTDYGQPNLGIQRGRLHQKSSYRKHNKEDGTSLSEEMKKQKKRRRRIRTKTEKQNNSYTADYDLLPEDEKSERVSDMVRPQNQDTRTCPYFVYMPIGKYRIIYQNRLRSSVLEFICTLLQFTITFICEQRWTPLLLQQEFYMDGHVSNVEKRWKYKFILVGIYLHIIHYSKSPLEKTYVPYIRGLKINGFTLDWRCLSLYK